jgi:hypothetical protein
LIDQADFEIERVENSYLKGAPRFGRFLYAAWRSGYTEQTRP